MPLDVLLVLGAATVAVPQTTTRPVPVGIWDTQDGGAAAVGLNLWGGLGVVAWRSAYSF
jgi:hypothetical protein